MAKPLKSTIPEDVLEAIGSAARKAKLDFVLLYGSAARSFARARDLDIAVNGAKFDLSRLSEFADRVECSTGKKADIVHLGGHLPPTLISEIFSDPRLIWVRAGKGRDAYVETVDRLLAIAEDERLSFPVELRKLSLRRAQRKLHGTLGSSR